ncbi:MAG TPA: VWA domain-containing protein [Pyrinomonadaceae bacterium]|jgi:VWFA-related protein|nr:VWA domain-containing protein [Pyrinomonadaceae bacterium]
MRPLISRQSFSALALVVTLALPSAVNLKTFAQSRRQPPVSNQKKNKRPAEGTQQPSQSGGQQQPPEELPPDIVGKPQEAETITVSTAVVNVDAVVYEKKSKQIITNLKKENFAIFEDGVKKETTNFSTPEAPITVAMVLEYSRLTDRLSGDYWEAGRYEVLRPMAMFLTQFVKPPDDYVSVIAFDIRPTPLTDFTNDPARLSQVMSLLLRSNPAFTETNLFDALKFTLVGGRGDAVVLDRSEKRTAEYDGMASLQGRRRAVILVCSGLDTFSKINYDQARKVAQNAGVPIYIIGTGNLFLKKYEDRLPAMDGNLGSVTPGRMSFLQAQNALRTFAKDTGGMYFPVTFQGELPSVLQTINAVLRSQYSLGYNPGNVRDGKQHKIVVKVDVNGDGVYDDKEYVVQSRQYYNAPKASDK